MNDDCVGVGGECLVSPRLCTRQTPISTFPFSAPTRDFCLYLNKEWGNYSKGFLESSEHSYKGDIFRSCNHSCIKDPLKLFHRATNGLL